MSSPPSLLALASLVLTVAACGQDKPAPSAATGQPAAPPATAPPAPAPPATAPPATMPPATAPATAPSPDSYAQGFCEYAVDGGAPNKGGGGMNNVLTLHWLAADQKGRDLASPLLINCGAGKQVNLLSSSATALADVPMAPRKYPIVRANQAGAFTVLGADFMGGEGELDVTAWDAAHVAGTFAFAANGKQYVGKFDLKCPFPSNGVCR